MYRLLNASKHKNYSVCFKIKAHSKKEARMLWLQHHMGLNARNRRKQQRHQSFGLSDQRLCYSQSLLKSKV